MGVVGGPAMRHSLLHVVAQLSSVAGAVWLADCNTEVLGCWQDSKPGDKSPGATGHRVLPYSVCPGGAPHQAAYGQCKTPDCKYEGRAAPTCEANKITPDECAQKCLDWVATPPPSASFTIWSGVEWTQECWCGDWHTQMTILSEHKAPNPGCSAKCRGDPSITCGGPGGPQGSAISIMKIECGYVDDGWGFSVLVVFLVVGSAYTGGGIAWNAKVHGRRGRDALPHQNFWREVHSLVIDGIAVTKRKLGMKVHTNPKSNGSRPMTSQLLTGNMSGRDNKKEGGKRAGTGAKEKKKKKRKDSGTGDVHGESEASHTPAPTAAPATPTPTSAAAGTAAGGGGRWVHVPN